MSIWIKFKLIPRPYVNKDNAGGMNYPEIFADNSVIVERHEAGNDLLLKLDVSQGEADSIVAESTVFMPEIISEQEADALKVDVFNVQPESGVT